MTRRTQRRWHSRTWANASTTTRLTGCSDWPSNRALLTPGGDGGGIAVAGGLFFVEVGVGAVEGDEVGVGALLDDAPVLDDDDAVGHLYGGKAVGDEEGGLGCGEVVKAHIDVVLGLGV